MILGLSSCAQNRLSVERSEAKSLSELVEKLNDYVSKKDASIGLAVIFDEGDTVAVNGDNEFPMQSVFKFPLALVVGEYLNRKSLTLSDSIPVDFDSLMEYTYSPMLKKYGGGKRTITYRELLEWSLKESDNNAADILLKLVGNPEGMMKLMCEMNLPQGIVVGASEEEMNRDNYMSYLNRSTPIAMAELFDVFDRELKDSSDTNKDIARMLENCKTGADRLSAPFEGLEARVGHKTGTGFVTKEGRISSINDCGYVYLPNGERYVIAVFIADSAYDMAETSKIVADISAIVAEYKQSKRND